VDIVAANGVEKRSLLQNTHSDQGKTIHKHRSQILPNWLSTNGKSGCLGCLVLHHLALDSTKELVVLIIGRLIREKGFLVKKAHQGNHAEAPVCPT